MNNQQSYGVENAHRQPYLSHYHSNRNPLMVLASLLSRADNTPLSHRRRDSNNLLDHEGKVITEPADSSQILALSSDPNISYEKWTEYWRKVHGPRFIHAQDTEEGKIQHLIRYDQVHRLSGGPTNFTPPLTSLQLTIRGNCLIQSSAIFRNIDDHNGMGLHILVLNRLRI